MANISSKIAPFPGCGNDVPGESAGVAKELGDPTKELRAFIDGLQKEAREARRRQELAEEERHRLADELNQLTREFHAVEQARQEARAIVSERDALRAKEERHQLVENELRRKLDGAERQRAQIESQRDQAIQLYKEIRGELDKHLSSRDEAVRQRDSANRLRAQAIRERDELSNRLAEVQKQLAEAQRESAANANRRPDGDVQKQLFAIRQARDSAAAQAADFKARVSDLADALATANYDLERSEQANKRLLAELDEMRKKIEESGERAHLLAMLQAEMSEIGQELTTVRRELATAQGAKEQLIAQLREFRETHDAALIANNTKLDALTRERELLRTRIAEREKELAEVRADLAAAWTGAMQVTEPEIERLTKELESLRVRSTETDKFHKVHEEIARQREEMRLQVIELNAQLENARTEIKQIGASLAEARLQLKMAGKHGAGGCELEVPAGKPAESNTEVASARIARLASAHEVWRYAAGDHGALWNVAKEAAAIAGLSQAAGRNLLHRVSSGLLVLLETLLENPALVTARIQKFVGQAIEALRQIEQKTGIDEKVQLSGARVYVVDDDPDACTLVTEVLRRVGFIVESAQHPSTAIATLAKDAYDLVILDVRLPEVSGFELSGYIRDLEVNANTPTVFVSGIGPEEIEGDAEVLTKPLLPAELALFSVLRVLQARMPAAS